MGLLQNVLDNPACVRGWPESYWEALFVEARQANLMSRVAAQIEMGGLVSAVPSRPAMHLVAAGRVAARQRHETRWEIALIRRAFAELGLPVILLKGAAYVARDLPCARGRLFGDVDLLVPRERLADVESCLVRHGWMTTNLDRYDQRYYRRWMHELPPMRHVVRDAALDVHHSITPLTSRYPVDGSALLARAEPVAGWRNVWTLAPFDLIIHSAIHLVLEGELDNGLRDLVDLRDLIEFHASASDFWPGIVERATSLGLVMPLALAVELVHDRFGVPVPDPDRLRAGRRRRALVRWLFAHALEPRRTGWLAAVARGLLYVRGHYLRMPLRLLLPHLIRKAWHREPDTRA